MRTTAQNKSSLVWAREGARRAVPSHLLLKSGQYRSAPRAFLSQCALVNGPDNRQTDAAEGKPKYRNRCHRRWRMDRPAKKTKQKTLSQHGAVRTRERGRIVPPNSATNLDDVTHLLCRSPRSSHVLQ